MPSLRFSLDKRGNEITSLVYLDRRHGKGHSRVLYWFRTPPNIRVGRAAIDENAIRALEESHPHLVFDWPRILQASKSVDPPGRGSAGTGPKRSRHEAGGGQIVARQPTPRAHAKPHREAPDEVTAALPAPEHQTAAQAVSGIVSHDDVVRLRGRFAEVLARISEQAGDPARADALRLEAEALNPDAWVTPDEVRKGVESFERVERRLREQLGGRRKTRRGGARHRRRSVAAATATSTGQGPPHEPVLSDSKPDGGSQPPEH